VYQEKQKCSGSHSKNVTEDAVKQGFHPGPGASYFYFFLYFILFYFILFIHR